MSWPKFEVHGRVAALGDHALGGSVVLQLVRAQQVRAGEAPKPVVAVCQVRGAAIWFQNCRCARKCFDAPTALLAILTIANTNEEGFAHAFATDAPTGARRLSGRLFQPHLSSHCNRTEPERGTSDITKVSTRGRLPPLAAGQEADFDTGSPHCRTSRPSAGLQRVDSGRSVRKRAKRTQEDKYKGQTPDHPERRAKDRWGEQVPKSEW